MKLQNKEQLAPISRCPTPVLMPENGPERPAACLQPPPAGLAGPISRKNGHFQPSNQAQMTVKRA
jgi:hypothetical protein